MEVNKITLPVKPPAEIKSQATILKLGSIKTDAKSGV